ncbi:MAG: decaprenyl-phosphate phosphoribosyltransferase [Armatimonadetes bacterium]|nr:decaprenyl-phosphate phosphoribosyltransferase [Anaerolineae bacterium]
MCRSSVTAIIVNGAKHLQALRGLLRTMRPRQWTKNLLFVFPAIIFDGQLFELVPFLRVLATFALLCVVSGTVYVINDLVDIESDRQHPRKKFRPLPAGELPIRFAQVMAVLMPTVAIGLSLLLTYELTIVLLAYLGIQLLYSFRLKHVVIIDLMVITAGFVLRVMAGVVVIDVQQFSAWLYVVTGLLALFLAISKRRQELILLGDNATNVRQIYKDYNLPLLDEMLRIVTTSTLITYILYTIETSAPLLARTNLALLTVPFVMYGLFRYLYLIYVRGEISPPDEVLLKDRGLQLTILAFGGMCIVILYLAPVVLNR